MRLSRSKPNNYHEMLVAAILDTYGIDYSCQVWFRNSHIEECDVQTFRADFVLVGLDIVVEVDDPGHRRRENQKRDAIKDRIYKERGFNILRIPTKELDTSVENVTGLILQVTGRQEKVRGW